MQDIKSLISEKQEYSKQDIVSLLQVSDSEVLNELYELADRIREKYVGNVINVYGIIEFSSYCDKNCLYCGVRRNNEKLHRYRMTEEKILDCAQKAKTLGYKTIILQSGEDPGYDIDTLTRIIKTIKHQTGLGISLNVGEKTDIEYKLMREAGADEFILKHETSDPILYRQLHPDLKFSNRIKCLRTLKKLGYITGSGMMVGLPGQTLESIANDILLLKSMDIEFIDIGPYLPHPNTPLSEKFYQTGGYFAPAIGYFNIEEMIYKIIAISRIVTKTAIIPSITPLDFINSKNCRENALKSGANAYTSNLTDLDFRPCYEVYPAKTYPANLKLQSVEEVAYKLKKLKREIQ